MQMSFSLRNVLTRRKYQRDKIVICENGIYPLPLPLFHGALTSVV